MSRDKSINMVQSPKQENHHTLVKEGKIVGTVTIIGQNEVQLQSTNGEVLGVYENTDFAVARLEELIDLQEFRIDPLG